MEQNAWKRRIFKKQQQIIEDNGGVPPLDLNEQVSEYAGSPESGMLSEDTKNKIKTIQTKVVEGTADYVDGVTNETEPLLPSANSPSSNSLSEEDLIFLKQQGIVIQPTQPNRKLTKRGSREVRSF
jgi:hypothetical protein